MQTAVIAYTGCAIENTVMSHFDSAVRAAAVSVCCVVVIAGLRCQFNAITAYRRAGSHVGDIVSSDAGSTAV